MQPSLVGYAEISTVVERIASAHGFRPGDDVFHLVRAMGGKVVTLCDAEALPRLLVREDGRFTIVLRAGADGGAREASWRAAITLGLYVLHHLLPVERGERAPGQAMTIGFEEEDASPEAMKEAIRFAATLLAPDEAVRHALLRAMAERQGLDHAHACATVAEILGVPAAFVRLRAEALGFVTPALQPAG